MRTLLLSMFLAAAVMVFPADALAEYSCNVTVKNVLVYSSGAVNILHTGRGDYTYVCNLDSTYNGVSPTTCAMWVALLEKIKSKGGTAAFWFTGTGSCETLPTYGNSPAPVYVGDVTP